MLSPRCDCLLVIFLLKLACVYGAKPPHIVFILADDVGWNDVGYHGSSQIPTPNIDALAYNGVILQHLYSQPSCTPSRAALLTGKYPMRFGYQGYPMRAGENRTLPFGGTLPSSLRELGYVTRAVGKWHMGYGYRNATPLGHGFDSHWGYWNGYIDYFDHTIQELDKYYGVDFHDDLMPLNISGYVTDLITQKSVDIIKQHDCTKPLYLQVNHLAPHTGKTITADKTVLQVKDPIANDQEFDYISDPTRRLLAGCMKTLDESLGEIVEALYKRKMLDNTIILFLSDNGAPTYDLHANAGSNFPLRGIKMSMYEGAVRVNGIIYSPRFSRKGRIYDDLVHFTDWYPTLYKAAGGDPTTLQGIDGIDQWNSISRNLNLKRRSELLVEIDEALNMSAYIGRSGRFKLIQNSNFYFNFTGDAGTKSNYNMRAVLASKTNHYLDKYNSVLQHYRVVQYRRLRKQATLPNCRPADQPPACTDVCLYDLWRDPCEAFNIAAENPDIVADIMGKIDELRAGLVKQQRKDIDPNADPALCHGTWFNWLDTNGCLAM